MSRAVLAVMAGLLCALAGIRHAAVLKGEALRLHRWEHLLCRLSLLLKEGSMSIPEALCAAADGASPADALLQDLAARQSAAPLHTLADLYRDLHNDVPESELLHRLFTHLGQGTKENRCLAVDHATEEMRLLARASAEKADKDAKLWQQLGLIGGTCLTILLL